MTKKRSLDTICIQGGWEPKTANQDSCLFTRARPLSTPQASRWDVCLIWKKTDISIQDWQTPPMTRSQPRSASWRAVWVPCLPQARRLILCGDESVSGRRPCGKLCGYLRRHNEPFTVTIPKMGVECTLVSPDATEEELAAAFRPNTKALFAETIANPALTVLDIEKFAKAAHDHGVPLIVDNTFATPINCRPFEWGADIVTHSTTKYMDGHAMTIGGCIVDSGNFDWEAHHDKFKCLTEPDESYHGVIYTQKFGKMAYITKATAQLMRDLGSIQSPQHAFLINVGLETLHLRMPRHCENAYKVASYLKSREDVAWVNYPGLEGDKYYELAKKYMPDGTCGVISFGLKSGREGAARFMNRLKLCSIETHVADSRTAVLHPASHTHRQLTNEQLVEAGVDPSMIRFSVGIEDAEDIIEDIREALEE